MPEHELWSFTNALFFIILISIILFVITFCLSTIFDVKRIKENWAENRCSPTIMPFASLFGHNTKENFEFCMGKVFATHSTPYMSSIGTMFSQSNDLLQSMFDSTNSLRNTVASLGGGINVIFQEFTDRISSFFFRMRLSAIQIKTLIGRMYAILFSVMYMGLSGITGMTSFTNTFLFSFLNTFCFPGNTELMVQGKGSTPIKGVKIGDVLLPGESKVTATFQFFSKGQPMVQLGSTVVSTNHYVLHDGKWMMASEHPNAVRLGGWDSDEPLYCLNTSDNKIPVSCLTFLDYDETTHADEVTMNFIESRINSKTVKQCYHFTEYCPAIEETTGVKTLQGIKQAKDIVIGDKLVTGSEVVGVIRRQVKEVCQTEDNTLLTPSTLFWEESTNQWRRIGTKYEVQYIEKEFVSFVVVPNSQVELETGLRIRDYMELCSPDSEMYYSKHLEQKKTA
jgi:hypothetical protein